MKKTLGIIFVLCVALFLVGCGEKAVQETTEAATGTTVTEGAEQTAEEPAAADEETEETTEPEAATEEAGAEETAVSGSVTVAGCIDSDGGKNYELSGALVDVRGVTDFDRCSENEYYPGRLYESYCKEDGEHDRETYDCPSGKCEAGACTVTEE